MALTGQAGSTGELWKQPGGKGTPITLTYSFVDGFFDHVKIKGGSPSDVKASVEKALSLYAKYAPINFVEVKDQGADTNTVRNKPVGIEPGDSQLRFHAYYQNGDGGVFGTAWLPSQTRAIGGDVFMDYETWESTADFVEDFTHELGHALGLEHSSDRNAIMYPTTWDRFSSLESADLLPDDIRTIQSAYGSGKGSVKTLNGSPITPNPQPNQPDGIGPDFNNDGKTDILWQNTATNQVEAWLMDGANRQSSRQIGALPQGLEVRAIGDFNGDGQDDLILQGQGKVEAWFLNGAQRSGSETIFSSIYNTNEQVRGAADFDGDGQTDLLVRNDTTGQTEIWMMNGTDWRKNVDLPTRQGQDWKIGGTADFNGDGSVDVLWRNQATGQNQVWYLNRGAYTASQSLPSLTNANQTVAGVGDYNQDGKVDVLWRNQATGGNTVWLLDGVRQIGSQSLSSRTDLAWQTDVRGEAAQTSTPIPTPSPQNTVLGTGGNDLLEGTGGADLIQGLSGNDTLRGLSGKDRLQGGNGDDLLKGGKGSDWLEGGQDNDTLEGRQGDDTLDGGSGNDILLGGSGNDILTGGVGQDTFVYDEVDHRRDTITDFELGVDKIDLSSIFKGSDYASANAFNDYVQLEQLGADTKVRVDILGDNGDQFKTMAQLTNVNKTALTAEHFVLA